MGDRSPKAQMAFLQSQAEKTLSPRPPKDTNQDLIQGLNYEQEPQSSSSMFKPVRIGAISTKQRDNPIIVCFKSSKEIPAVLSTVFNDFCWKVQDDKYFKQGNWDLLWSDGQNVQKLLLQLTPFQKINHFPGMNMLTNQLSLFNQLKNLKLLLNRDYSFFPETWFYPQQMKKIEAFMNTYPEFKLVYKGDHIQRPIEFQGLAEYNKQVKNVEAFIDEKAIIQAVITDPLKFGSSLFKIKTYVLVTSCQPFTIFMHQDSLAVPDSSDRSPVLLATILNSLGISQEKVVEIMMAIYDLSIKTLLSIQQDVATNYKVAQPQDQIFDKCFQVLEFKLILDSSYKPWLINVKSDIENKFSYGLESDVKQQIFNDALRLINCSNQAKKLKRNVVEEFEIVDGNNKRQQDKLNQYMTYRSQHESLNCGRFTKIYPFDKPENNLSYTTRKQTSKLPFINQGEKSKLDMQLTRIQKFQQLVGSTPNQIPLLSSRPIALSPV